MTRAAIAARPPSSGSSAVGVGVSEGTGVFVSVIVRLGVKVIGGVSVGVWVGVVEGVDDVGVLVDVGGVAAVSVGGAAVGNIVVGFGLAVTCNVAVKGMVAVSVGSTASVGTTPTGGWVLHAASTRRNRHNILLMEAIIA